MNLTKLIISGITCSAIASVGRGSKMGSLS